MYTMQYNTIQYNTIITMQYNTVTIFIKGIIRELLIHDSKRKTKRLPRSFNL